MSKKECSLCFDKIHITEHTILPCKHILHLTCLNKLIFTDDNIIKNMAYIRPVKNRHISLFKKG